MTFDAGRIVATADLDRTPFQRGITEIRAEGRRLQGQTFKANVGADTREGDAKILDFRRKLDQVSTGKSTAKVSADTTEALLKIKPLTDRLAELRDRVSTARVDLAGNDRAQRALDQLDLSLRQVGTITSKPRVSLSGAESAEIQLDRLALKLRAVGAMTASPGVSGGSGGFLSSLSSLGSHAPGGRGLAIAGALPLIPPLAGLAAGGAASFLTPTVAGGLAGGLFAKTAQSTYKGLTTTVQTLTADQTALASATTATGRAAALAQKRLDWRSLSKPQQDAVKNMRGLDSAWTSFQHKLQPQSFKLLSTGADIGAKALHLMLPATKAAGNAIDSLASSADHALSQPFWQDFFTKFLPGQAHSAIMTLGTDLGHVGTGVANLVEKFAPLGTTLEHDSRRWTKSFEGWTQGQGPAKFVAWVQKEGPVAARAIGGLAHAVEGLGKGFAPIGHIELKALTPVLDFIGKLGDEHPAFITAFGTALLGVAGGLKAISLVSGISTTAKAVGALYTALRSGKGISSIPDILAGSKGGGGLGCCCPPGTGGPGTPGTPGEKTPPEEGKTPFSSTLRWVGGTAAAGIGGYYLGKWLQGQTGPAPDPHPNTYQSDPAIVQRILQQLPSLEAQALTKSGLVGATRVTLPQSAGLKFPAVGRLPTQQQLASLQFVKQFGSSQQLDSLIKRLGQVAQTSPKAAKALRTFADENPDVASKVKQAMSTQYAYNSSVDQAKNKVQGYAASLAAQGRPLADIIAKTARYASTLKGVPRGTRTQITIQGIQTALNNLNSLKAAIASVSGPHTGSVSLTLPGGHRLQHPGGSSGLATGGRVHGPGTGTSDSVPAWLSNGEYVVNARSTSRHLELLHAINAGHFASGGHAKHPGTSSSSTSSTKSSGPSKATIANALASIAQFAGLTFVNDLEGTAKTIKSGITQMIDRLNNAVRNHYLAGDKKLVTALKGSQKTLVNLANTEDQVSKSLTAAQSRLSSLRSDASQVRSSAVGSFLGLGDLTQASSTTTLGGLLSVDSQQVKVAKAFHRNLETLRKKGLSQAEYRTLEAAGPGAAGNIVGLLATANKSQIGQFNHDESILHTLGVSTGKASATYLDGQRITDARKEVAKYRTELHQAHQDQRRTAIATEKLAKAGLQDKGTHAALATLHKDNAEIKQLLRHIGKMPGQAKQNHRTHVPGVHS